MIAPEIGAGMTAGTHMEVSMSRSHSFRPFAAALAILALGIASQAVAQTPVRIMPLGDSITAAPGCWRAYLWTQLQAAGVTNIDFVGTSTDRSGCGFAFDEEHEGHSGFSITGIADQNLLPAWLAAANPSIVVVHLGTNDMWGHFIALQTKLTAFTRLIGQMRAHNPGMKIIVAQIIPMDPANCTTCNADVIEFNNALPAWAAGLSTAQSPITLVNQFTGFDVGADTFDRVHPVDSGFRKMAARFFPAVTAALNGTPPGPTLTVTRAGAGTGTIASSPAGINCGTACAASFPSGTSVTLTAAAAGGSTFAGWSGACTGTSGCTVSMTQARSVTVTFNMVTPTSFPLAVTRAGTGSGTVTSNPAGINCGTACTANYNSGASVTLAAAAAGGSTFAGWNGACTGTGPCTLSITAARNVTATFNSSGGTGGSCANPVTFSGNSGNFNTTGAACYRTNATINGWGCYNFDGRTLTVGGVVRTCGQMPLTRAADGYYYFAASAGQFPWAGLFTW